MNNHNLIRNANQDFRNKNYSEALTKYRTASSCYKEGLFDLNKKLCLDRFSAQLANDRSGHTLLRRKRHEQEAKHPKDIRVALIADEFTFNSFINEFTAIPVDPKSWRDQFKEQKPEIFFCESAWSGPDSRARPWKGKIYASTNFPKENRVILLEILAYCRKNGIVSVFWNKEDPTHYADRIHDFPKTAAEFDHIFTTAEECVEGYARDYGSRNVYALPFATNPRLFNPFQNHFRQRKDLVFAGSWYENHKERCTDIYDALESCRQEGLRPVIYDRYHDDEDPLHQWPDRYKDYLRPGLPHSEIANAYKSSVFGLNINTVKSSPTMFARRVFELMSCRTIVVSNHSLGCKEMFGELMIFPKEEPGRIKHMSDLETQEIVDKAAELVLARHTYKQRWWQILDSIGFPYSDQTQGLTFACYLKSQHDAIKAISIFDRFRYIVDDSRLLLVAGHGVDNSEILDLYTDFNQRGIMVFSECHLERYAVLERSCPVETEYFVGFDISSIPPRQWIKQAFLYSDSASYLPIKKALSSSQAFSTSLDDLQGYFMAHSTLFNEWLLNKNKKRPFAFV